MFSLLLMQIPHTWLPRFLVHIEHQKPEQTFIRPICVQYTNAQHVVGFAPSQVLVGQVNHALIMTFMPARSVEPVTANEFNPPASFKAEDASRYLSKKSATFIEKNRLFTHSVEYVHPWPKITIQFKPHPHAILKSEYSIEAGFTSHTLAQIRMQYNRPIQVDGQGRLNIFFGMGTMIESAPVAWQEIGGQKKYVRVEFQKRGTQAVGFGVYGYDNRYPLLIDPSLTWNSFLGQGGSEDNKCNSMAVDTSGNSYLVGESAGPWGNPLRPYCNQREVFAAKLDNNGNLIWNTFLGGNASDYGSGIVLDAGGNIYVAGESETAWGNPQQVFAGNFDGFVAKLDHNGNMLWNTFVGGNTDDRINAIAVDNANQIIVGGSSNASWGAPLRLHMGGSNAFVAKLDSSGYLTWNTFLNIGYISAIASDGSNSVYATAEATANWGAPVRLFSGATDPVVVKLDSSGNLIWNTFLGGSASDRPNGLALDSSSHIYVTGESSAAWGAPVRAFNNGSDAFVAKLDNQGVLQWNTFLGGASSDYGYAMTLDSGGSVYVTGESYGTWGAPKQAYGNLSDPYVAKLDSNGNLLWNTFLGGGNDGARGVGLDGSNNIYVSGYSNATWGTPVRPYTNGQDGFALRLDSNGNLIWNTFFGSEGDDYGTAIAVDGSNHVYVGGYSSTDWGSPMRAHNSKMDMFVAKLDSTGNREWHTFLGGNGVDYGYALAVDQNDNVYACGCSDASWGTPVRAYSNALDVFVAKLAGNGVFLWNTFLGSTGFDEAKTLTVDSDGNAYIAGGSAVTWGMPVRPFSSTPEAFAAKLNSNGSLQWNTFLGGAGNDYANAIARDGSGKIHIAGYSSANWGTPVHPYSSGYDAFAVQLDNNGNLQWNTFLGGAGSDYGTTIALSETALLVGGNSDASWGTPVRAYGNNRDSFAAKLDRAGNLIWNTFLGSVWIDYGSAVAVAGDGSTYVVGTSSSTWGTPLRPYTNSSSSNDGFVAKLAEDGTMLWNMFLGGVGVDYGSAVAAFAGHLYLVGYGNAGWGTPVAAFGGSNDAFVVQIMDATPTPIASATPIPITTASATPSITLTPFMSRGYKMILVKSLVNRSKGEKVIFRFYLDQAQTIAIQIYDLTGRRWFDFHQMLTVGDQDVIWNEPAAGTGLYMAYIQSASGQDKKKIVMVH